MQIDEIREEVRAAYGQADAVESTKLGCGDPVTLAGLAPGEVVLDLGSGAGLDALNAAPQLGDQGRCIGVDMTPAMLERARTNAVGAGLARTVEFREGVIEDLPVASATVDVVISNCVVNLSPDKPAVFREIFRVLKPRGRVAISDIVLGAALPEDVFAEIGPRVCVAGALTVDEFVAGLEAAGFEDVRVEKQALGCMLDVALEDPTMKELALTLGPARLQELAGQVFSARVEARRPA